MKKILIVDDSQFIWKQVEEMLKDTEYEIVGQAKTGEEGIKLYKELNPDVVTLDIIMPGMDGIDTACAILKEDKKAKIIMLSSLCDTETLEEVNEIGIKYLIPKPFEREILLSSLAAVFGQI